MILWNIGIVCFIIELHQFTSGTPLYIPQKRKVFLLYTSIESTYICKSFHFFPLKIRVKSSLSPSSFSKERMSAVYLYGHISPRRLWRLEMAKSDKNPKWRTQTTLQLLKMKNLQHKTPFLACIYIFPLVTYKDFPFYGKYYFMKYP
jgi:hypothetical protein